MTCPNVSHWIEFALSAINDGALSHSRLLAVLTHAASHPPSPSPVCLTLHAPIAAGNAYFDGQLVQEWRWWPSPTSRSWWSQGLDTTVSVEQVMIELSACVATAGDGIYRVVGTALSRQQAVDPGWVERQLDDTLGIQVPHAVWAHMMGACVRPMQGIATMHGLGSSRLPNDPRLAARLRLALDLGQSGLADLMHDHDGVVLIARYLSHRLQKKLAVSTSKNLLSMLLPLTCDEAEDFFSEDAFSAMALCDALIGQTLQVTTGKRRALMMDAIQFAVRCRLLADGPQASGDQRTTRCRVRAVLVAEWQWILLLRWWSERASGWPYVAGLVCLILWGRAGLRLSEVGSLLLADAHPDAIIFRRTRRYGGKTVNAPRRIEIDLLLCPAEREIWRTFLDGQAQLLAGAMALHGPREILLLSPDGLTPYPVIELSRWVGVMMRLLTGAAVGGAHALRHVALSRLAIMLTAPLEVAAHWCQLSIDDVAHRRRQLLKDGADDPESVLRGMGGHSQLGLSGEAYRHGDELSTVFRVDPTFKLPKPGPLPPVPQLGPHPLMLPALVTAVCVGAMVPPAFREWALRWRAAAARVAGWTRREGSPRWTVDPRTCLPLVRHRWQRELVLRLMERLVKFNPADICRLADRIRVDMGSDDRPGVRYEQPDTLKAELPLWRCLSRTGWAMVPVPAKTGASPAVWEDLRLPFYKEVDSAKIFQVRLVLLSHGRVAGKALHAVLFAIAVLAESQTELGAPLW